MKFLFSFVLSFFVITNIFGAAIDSCNGQLVSSMNGITNTTSATLSGYVDRSGDQYDYYYFQINSVGTLSYNYSSNKNTDLYISKSSCGSDNVSSNQKSSNGSIALASGDIVYIEIKGRDNQNDSYSLGLVFTSIAQTAPSTPYSENSDNPSVLGFDVRETSIGMADSNRSITTKIVNKSFSLNVISLDSAGALGTYMGVDKSRVYLFTEDTSVCSLSDADKRTAIASSARDWYVTFNTNDTNQVTPNSTPSVASKDKKIVMNYINWSQAFADANFNCSNSNTQGILKGVPQCLNSNKKIEQVFPTLAATCLGGARPACEPNSYATSGVPSAPYDNDYGCYQCLAGGAGSITCSTDNFAIRPNSFSIATPSGENSNLLTSAQEYTFPLTAVQYGATTATNNYTVTNANTVLSLTRTMYQLADTQDNSLSGTLAFSATPFNISNGVGNPNPLLSFDDVGKVNIQLQDTTWAAVDANDTSADCSSSGRYICGDVNATFIPEHFTLSAVHLNNEDAGTFTYFSDDLNMSAHLDINVTAKNLNDVVTQNFKSGSWENPTNINIAVASATVTPTLNKDDINETQKLGFTLGALSIPWNETNTTKKLMFNFNRSIDDANNPFMINGSEVTLQATSTYTDSGITKDVSGSSVADQNATFVYGRTHAPRYRFLGDGASKQAFIYYEVFCNGTDSAGTACDKTLLPNGVNSTTTDDPRWFINTNNTSTSGIAGTVVQRGASLITVDAPPTGNHQDSVWITYDGSKGYPYKATMQNTPSSWLIYNKYNAAATTNEFEVEFEGSGSWVGQHDNNTTTIKSGTDKTNRRTMW